MNPIDLFLTPLFGLDLAQYVAILLIIVIAIKWVIPPIVYFCADIFSTKPHVPHEESYLDEHPMQEVKGSSGFQLIKVIAIIVIITTSVIIGNEFIPINALVGSDPRVFPNTQQKEMIEFCENKFYLINSEWLIENPDMFMTGCVNGGAESTEFFRGYIPVEDRVVTDVTNGTTIGDVP